MHTSVLHLGSFCPESSFSVYGFILLSVFSSCHIFHHHNWDHCQPLTRRSVNQHDTVDFRSCDNVCLDSTGLSFYWTNLISHHISLLPWYPRANWQLSLCDSLCVWVWEFGLTCACVWHSDKGHVKWEQRDATQTLSCMWAEVGLGGGWGRTRASRSKQKVLELGALKGSWVGMSWELKFTLIGHGLWATTWYYHFSRLIARSLCHELQSLPISDVKIVNTKLTFDSELVLKMRAIIQRGASGAEHT